MHLYVICINLHVFLKAITLSSGKQLKVNPLRLCQPMAGTDTTTIQAATASFPLKNLLIYYGIIFSIPENALCDNNNNV